MCPQPPAEFKAFLAQNRALLRGWRTRGFQTSVFIEWIGPRVPLTPKDLQFCGTFCVHVLKTTVNVDSKSKLCAPSCTLSFSLRFCSVFKMHYKTRLKVKSLPKKRDSLHTCSNEKRFLGNNFEKTTAARTRVQSALALGTFTAVLSRFLRRGRFWVPRALWAYVR